MPNTHAPKAPFVEQQKKVFAHLQEKYAEGRKILLDKLDEAVVWATSPKDALQLVMNFQSDPQLMVDYLSDLTAYDNKDKKDGPKRFVVVYQLASLKLSTHIRIKFLVDESEEALTLTGVWPAANWLEREVYDMYGIRFRGHPNLRRILMDERFTGFPLRKEYPIKKREPFTDNIQIHFGGRSLSAENKEEV